MNRTPPFAVRKELEGWTLFWARLETVSAGEESVTALCAESSKRARERYDLEKLSADPTVAALRRLFRAAGCDPTRYRPSSEALLRRILKGEDIPSISPLVDLNNCLSAELAVPCCVMAEGTFEPPIDFRSGRPGESYVSLRGPFRLEGKPLLCDVLGPLDTPITGNERVKVTPDTKNAWLVAYLPAEVLKAADAGDALERLVKAAPAVRIVGTAAS